MWRGRSLFTNPHSASALALSGPATATMFDVNIDMANLGKGQSAIVSHFGVDSAGTVERTNLERQALRGNPTNRLRPHVKAVKAPYWLLA